MAGDVQEPKVKMTKKARVAARRKLRQETQKSPHDIASGTPMTMPTSHQRMHPGMDASNANNYGAKIIPR